jgi:RNA polymerase sigma-70 factor (ECF subfamily)
MSTSTNKKSDKVALKKKTGEKPVHVGILENVGIEATKPTKANRIEQLVTRCQDGDQVAFRAIYEEFASGVHRHLSILIGPGPDADDLLQLVFLNVFKSISRFKGKSSFSTWLFRVTVNVARQEIRSKGRRRRLGDAAKEVSGIHTCETEKTPERQLLVQQQLYGILDMLPYKKRETYILYVYEGYSLDEIATLLGSTTSTIGSRLQSARKEIVKLLAGGRRT